MAVWMHKGRTAIAGIGTTPYYKRGTCPESATSLTVRAIVDACEDAGVDPRDVDGFVSYGADHSSGTRLAPSLGTREVRWSAMAFGGGGSGTAPAVAIAASAILAGFADTVVVYRGVSQTEGRLLELVKEDHMSPQYEVNGLVAPVEFMALRTRRMIDVAGVPQSTMRAFVRAAYHHAARNPAASSGGMLVSDADYDDSRLIAEPYHLFDCSRENDGAAAVIVTSAERARDLRHPPAYVLAAPQSIGEGWGERGESNDPYWSSGFFAVRERLWADSGHQPDDIDVVQVYENTVGLAIASLIELGFCTPESSGEFFRFENLIAPNGGLPINTAGGNIAEGFFHGMGLILEGVRQIRGHSVNQVPGARLSLVTGGPGGQGSAVLLGAEADS
ncbi:MAG: thiolase C-terminal domain-containing protein [Desertimonas sp.]